ncbi:L-rhamnose mutarotase [Seonamhaeicola sp.]|uniref:L-rhamnose mutarotase n=1 Tax=Seonamhaeicola sp. TaxID=1912245 RepID=UPI00261DDCC1|nr:L-rhamnose mutarotase [Seonamhaeicola sp.]
MRIKFLGALLLTFLLMVGCRDRHIKRVGMVIKIKPEMTKEYKKLHTDSNPGVRDLLTKYHIENFSIFLQQIDSVEFYEFGYYEYTGSDFKEDMEQMAKEVRTIEWLKICNPMQIPLEGSNGWTEMEQIYFNE